MPSSRTINIILILVGLALAVGAQTYEPTNQYLLIAGIMVIMFAIYRISTTLTSREKHTEDNNENALDGTFDEKNLEDLPEETKK